MMPWTAWLVLIGGALQIIGVGMVVFDVHQTSQALRSYKGRPIKRFGSAFLSGGGSIQAQGSGGSRPSLEDRVTSLEALIPSLSEEVGERLQASEDRMRREIRAIAKNTEATLEDQMEGLREFLRDLTKDGWRRLLAAAFIVAGLILVTIGGVAGIDSPSPSSNPLPIVSPSAPVSP
jgi:hypothetical protein